MKRALIAGALFAALIAGLTPGGASFADKPKGKAPTLKDLEKRKVEVRTSDPVPASTAKAMENYRAFLDLNSTDPVLRSEALRRLADLNLEASEIERAEREQIQAEGFQGTEAIKLYTLLLKTYPDYAGSDAVLYQLARAYESAAQPEEALKALNQLTSRFPKSRLIDEAQFRRGEILFSAQRYDEAEQAYAKVVNSGATSTFYEQSLYKQGWAQFKLSRNEDSLNAFGTLLDRKLIDKKDRSKMVDMQTLSRPERELIDDSLRVTSIMFSYMDGADSANTFVSQRGTPPYTWLVYASLGDLYIEKERYQDAAQTYEAFVKRNAVDANAPLLQVRAIEAYRKGGFASLVITGKQDFVERYGFGTPFWEGREPKQFPAVVAELKTSVMELARHYHAQGQKERAELTKAAGQKKPLTAEALAAAEGRVRTHYQQAARGYRNYLQWFPGEPESPSTNFLLAEALFESKQFREAAEEYERTAYQYPPHAKATEAGYAALLAYEEQEKLLAGAEKSAWHAKAVESGLMFAGTWPEHPASPVILTRSARELFDLKNYDRAVETAQRVLAIQPPVDADKRRIALTVVAHSRFEQARYADAEAAYLQLRAAIPSNDKEQASITEKLAAAVYKQAEEKQAAGDAGAAVDAFLRVSQVAPGSSVAKSAEYDAAAALVNMKEWPRAIDVLESFRRNNPQDPLAAEATRSLAIAYTETQQYGKAASEFERIADDTAVAEGNTPDVRREALWRAAEFHEKANNTPAAGRDYEQFIQRYASSPGQSFDQGIEARQKLADFASAQQDNKTRDRWLKDIIDADRAAAAARTDRSKYLAAKAQLAFAQPEGAAFEIVKLRQPLKKSLVTKKAAMEQALQAYGKAAEYGVGEVTTAATYSMAELYRTLAKDLMASERPPKLNAEELEQYDLLLEEQAFPFEEKSIGIHEANAARTRDEVYDQWVRKSMAVLAELQPARYGKKEPDLAALPELPEQLQAEEQTLKTQLQANPSSVEQQTRLGLVYRKLGRFKDAEGAYNNALTLDPINLPATLNVGVLYDLYLQEPQRALEAYERYRQLIANPPEPAPIPADPNAPAQALSENSDKSSTAKEGPVSSEVVATWIAELKRRLGSNAGPQPEASGAGSGGTGQ